jgi:hypothetical protein
MHVVRTAHVVTSIMQSPVLKGHLILQAETEMCAEAEEVLTVTMIYLTYSYSRTCIKRSPLGPRQRGRL